MPVINENKAETKEVTLTCPCLDAALTLDCGQAFRWAQQPDGGWHGVAYGLLNFANSHLTVSESSLFSNVTTVVSVLAGVLFLKEDFSLWQALGVVIILVCVFVANVSGSEKK